jgi:hypothetical protein
MQKELAEPDGESRADGVWRVLNNTFTIFLLSSVILPGTAWLHANRAVAEKTKAALVETAHAREIRIDMLDSEIAFRFSRAISQLAAANAISDQRRADLVSGAVGSLTIRTKGGEMQTLYPSFAEQSALSLMSELRSELIAAGVHSEEMSPTVDGTVGRAIKSLSVFSMLDHSAQSPEYIAGQLLDIVIATKLSNGVRRWDKEFAYTDCASKKPFC